MNTHNHGVAVVSHAARSTPARLTSTLAGLVAPLLAAVFLLACAPMPPADSPQAGNPAASERRPAHWETDGLQRSGNHGTRMR